jgi:membrane protein DedA with SNARE-associated domain
MMPFTPFLLWTTAGSLIWTLMLTLAGYALGEAYVNVETWLEPVAKVIKVLLVLAVLGFTAWLALRTWKKRQDSH